MLMTVMVMVMVVTSFLSSAGGGKSGAKAADRQIFCKVHHKMETQRHACAVGCDKCKDADNCCCRTTTKCSCNPTVACCK
jgi:hypothetical protein